MSSSDLHELSFSPEDYPTLSRYMRPLKASSRKIIGRDMEVVKGLSALARYELCNPLFLGEAGLGKAHPNDTLIAVNDEREYVRIDELVIGDEVFGRYGEPVTVSGIFPQGELPLFFVNFVNGSSVPCNDQHLWDVRCHSHSAVENSYRTMELRSIVSSGLLDDRGRPTWGVPAAGEAGQPDVMIESVEDAGRSVEMTCIMVDSDDHLYQIGRERIVTHNTSIVQAMMLVDDGRSYFEVDLERMLEDHDPGKMAAVVKRLFDEAEDYHTEGSREIVMFMDEIHRLISISPMSVEAIKPVLAASGARGLKIITATTKEEYLQHIAPNAPLAERFQRIDVDEPSREVVISILRGFVERYHQSQHFPTDRMFHMIYDYSNRYVPESVQPRKSIKILDEMFGMHTVTGRPMDEKLLADVIYSSTGNNVAFRVDVDGIERHLNEHIFGQELAARAVAKRLHLAIAGFNDSEQPMGTFLFCGNTGTGKTALSKQIADLLFGDGRRHFIRFDMAEFSDDTYVERFREDLTAKVWSAPYSVILLDEIEKAGPAISRLLLSVFDDGRLTDRNGREVSFKNSWIICTTNAGAKAFSNSVYYINEDEGLKHYLPLIGRAIRADDSFPTELYNRIHSVVPFMPLLPDIKTKIIMYNLIKFYNEVRRRHNVKIESDERVLEYLAYNVVKTDTDDGGARGAIRAINDEVATAVAEFINKNPDVRVVKMGVEGTLRSEDRFSNETDAKVVLRRG